MGSMLMPSEVARLFESRSDPARDLARDLARQAGAVAEVCHAMAVRVHRGGRLIVFGTGGPSADAQHVAVEFVHPAIVGKRALPAISLTVASDDPCVIKEMQVTTYHVLWELVHVFFEQPGVLDPGVAR